ncbi:hypothetical protein K438DRAFT_1764850 [Mycena galopus ATCC 62051]|nr:hypothetical protein K438DRAFT_1764850 [Mycena galopus ATCC 62051]
MSVARILLLLLAIQHELEEPLNLNGAMFEDLGQGTIIRVPDNYHWAVRAMLLATRPKWLSHKKYWESQWAFLVSLRNFNPTILPPTLPIDLARPPASEHEDTPAPQRQAMSRTLRPRGPKGPRKEKVVAVPVAKIVASGPGWITVDVPGSDTWWMLKNLCILAERICVISILSV